MVKEMAERQLNYYRGLYNKEKKVFDDPKTPALKMRYAGCRMLDYLKKIKY